MKKILSSFFLLSIYSFLSAQDDSPPSLPSNNAGEIHGNIQLDAQYYNPDSGIGAAPVPEKMLMNGFANINYVKGNFKAGIRYESYLNTLQGFDPRYKGNGIPYRYANYVVDELEVTAGNFYEQFGSGMVLRAYEEKGLGIDNVFDGLRLKYTVNGFYLKGLVAKQRSYFSQGPGIVRGFDGEVRLGELIRKWADSPTQIIFGGSFVSKFQDGDKVTYQTSTLNVPENVGASAGRISINRKKINVMAEYAYKINDPSASNKFIYRPGEAILLNAAYSQKGFGLSLGAKRTDNFSFKSDRTATGSDLNINFLSSLTRQHTYSLLAFYPYATQSNGEIGYQIDIQKKLNKETKLGGKYGTDLAINFSGANGLDTTPTIPMYDSSRIGYTTHPFALGDAYFQDLNIEITRKFSPKFKLVLIYTNQVYNKNVIQGLKGYETIYSNIGMTELTYKISSSKSVRIELQHLSTKQDYKNWAMGLVEYGTGENWLISLQDQYNYGNDKANEQLHYYNATVVYVKNATRIALGYGRQRAGIFCVGGVCRYVPASNGLMLSVTSSF
ncbi:MAG: hypothetical protein EPN85_02450 [Bacteroidetes bacterium]|nr:MAG: hypothetical protein EPN85_02450 [Bacteroidota bacterium]